MCSNYKEKGGRHSSVDSSAPTTCGPGFESQAYHLSFYSEIGTKFVIVLRKGRK